LCFRTLEWFARACFTMLHRVRRNKRRKLFRAEFEDLPKISRPGVTRNIGVGAHKEFIAYGLMDQITCISTLETGHPPPMGQIHGRGTPSNTLYTQYSKPRYREKVGHLFQGKIPKPLSATRTTVPVEGLIRYFHLNPEGAGWEAKRPETYAIATRGPVLNGTETPKVIEDRADY